MIKRPRYTATSASTSLTIGGCGGGWRTSRALSESSPAVALHPKRLGLAGPASRFCSGTVWWQWTTHGHGMDEPDQAAMLTAVDAILAGPQQPPSRASGPDRIVGMMSASGPHHTTPSNGGRGATMGPPGCPLQSPPVPFRRRPSRRFAGIKWESRGLEETKGIPEGRGPWFESRIAHFAICRAFQSPEVMP
jgi:hypothetical protein